MTSAYAPFSTSYTNRVPYITAQEYQSAPTAMDTTNLVAGGGSAAQMTALNETIARASSWIDQYTMGAWGTLCATVEIENGRVYGNNGRLIVHPKYWPILEVDSFSFSTTGVGFAGQSAASIEPAGSIWIEPQQFIVQPTGVVGFGLTSPGGIGNTQYYCQWSYVTGYPTSTLAASVAAGASAISPVSVTGIYPGTTLSIYDEPNNEQIVVDSSYIPGSSVVPLAFPLGADHSSGVMVSNLPPAVKQAAILATTGFIKQRGSGALIVADIGDITRTQSGFSQNSGSDWDQAKMLLNPYRQMFVGY